MCWWKLYFIWRNEWRSIMTTCYKLHVFRERKICWIQCTDYLSGFITHGFKHDYLRFCNYICTHFLQYLSLPIFMYPWFRITYDIAWYVKILRLAKPISLANTCLIFLFKFAVSSLIYNSKNCTQTLKIGIAINTKNFLSDFVFAIHKASLNFCMNFLSKTNPNFLFITLGNWNFLSHPYRIQPVVSKRKLDFSFGYHLKKFDLL